MSDRVVVIVDKPIKVVRVEKEPVVIGVPGLQGPPGTDGIGITILGAYASLAALQTAHPTGSVGDVYSVQTHLYVWSEDATAWIDAGSFTGPAGTPGQIRFTGHGAPGTIIGATPLDLYLDMDSGAIYQLT